METCHSIRTQKHHNSSEFFPNAQNIIDSTSDEETIVTPVKERSTYVPVPQNMRVLMRPRTFIYQNIPVIWRLLCSFYSYRYVVNTINICKASHVYTDNPGSYHHQSDAAEGKVEPPGSWKRSLFACSISGYQFSWLSSLSEKKVHDMMVIFKRH